MTERWVRLAPICTRGPRYHNDSFIHSNLQEETERWVEFSVGGGLSKVERHGRVNGSVVFHHALGKSVTGRC